TTGQRRPVRRLEADLDTQPLGDFARNVDIEADHLVVVVEIALRRPAAVCGHDHGLLAHHAVKRGASMRGRRQGHHGRTEHDPPQELLHSIPPSHPYVRCLTTWNRTKNVAGVNRPARLLRTSWGWSCDGSSERGQALLRSIRRPNR